MEPKHSKLGISSFVISILCGLAMFATFVIAGYLEATTPGGMDEEAMSTALVGFAMIGIMFAQVVAFGLGIAGVIQKNAKKVFSVLGIVFSSMTIFLALLLMLVGIAMGA